MKTPKNTSLEAVRGLAAIVVVLWHCCVGFLPRYTGVFQQYAAHTWQGNPLFFLINGPSAVYLFFVLSGYVLTRTYLASGDTTLLLKATIKRWPRLVGPVLATIFCSYFFFKANFYAFEEAGKLSGSPWLVKFAYAYDIPPLVSLWDALKQGLFFVFFRGDSYYDSSLWTMRPEFIGSFIAFGMAPVMLEARKKSTELVVIVATTIALLTHFAMPSLVAFPIGVLIATILPNNKIISKWAAYGMLFLAFYLLGYSGNDRGAYSIFALLPFHEAFSIYPAILSGTILICLVETFPPLRRLLSGPISRWLGEYSFPVYLLHVLIICSLGSTVYLTYGSALAIFSVLVATPIAAFPLLVFNRKWVAMVNRAVGALVK